MTCINPSSFACSALLALLLAGSAAPASAQTYPPKPIRLIVPFAPGGPSDVLARTLAQKLTEAIKQTVIVDNRATASGTAGTDLGVGLNEAATGCRI